MSANGKSETEALSIEVQNAKAMAGSALKVVSGAGLCTNHRVAGKVVDLIENDPAHVREDDSEPGTPPRTPPLQNPRVVNPWKPLSAAQARENEVMWKVSAQGVMESQRQLEFRKRLKEAAKANAESPPAAPRKSSSASQQSTLSRFLQVM